MSNEILEMLDYKPSAVIDAMVEGLVEQSQRNDFVIDMNSFGHSIGNVCYGCAATAAVQKIFNTNFLPSTIDDVYNQSHALNIYKGTLLDFEVCVNEFRSGSMRSFLKYFEFKIEVQNMLLEFFNNTLTRDFFMSSKNWETYIPVLREVVLELREMGY